jgi:hypothetical protein
LQFSICKQWRRDCSLASTNAHKSFNVVPMGHSLPQCLPAAIAASITGVCHSHGVAVYTKSTSSRCTSFSKSFSLPVYTAGAGIPASVIIFTARSAFAGTTSAMAVMRTPSMATSSESTERPRNPVPTMPMRTTSRFSNGTPRIVAAGAGRGGTTPLWRPAVIVSAIAGVKLPAAAIPAPATTACFRMSRRDGLCGVSMAGKTSARGEPPPGRDLSRMAPRSLLYGNA